MNRFFLRAKGKKAQETYRDAHPTQRNPIKVQNQKPSYTAKDLQVKILFKCPDKTI